MRAVAPDVLEEALNKIYTTIAKLKIQLLSSDDYRFYAREEVLNTHRDYLVNLIEDESIEQSVKDLAIRLIILIGNLRSSGEDYLVAYNLIAKYDMKVNLNAEISMNRCFHQANKMSSKCSFKVNEVGSSEVTIIHQISQGDLQEKHTFFGFDENYAYLDISDIGILKVGLSDNALLSPGIVY